MMMGHGGGGYSRNAMGGRRRCCGGGGKEEGRFSLSSSRVAVVTSGGGGGGGGRNRVDLPPTSPRRPGNGANASSLSSFERVGALSPTRFAGSLSLPPPASSRLSPPRFAARRSASAVVGPGRLAAQHASLPVLET
uniref:Uncharacterized protein n=1 Tax=Odontella aurita TaxID=265563 RepID=A0A7S4MUT6_9STRA|mmetsp:Transcript_34056/g.101772  ORF Transcript_34056/g.101772 Transcript_34056/m.101772 type:complete len:136 (+) Transcript_34056:574-981(+)